ncbi:MAG TPA: hypothetical protein VGY32_00915, partial [Solirubrobacteraceae bacterium]|nr:hypothetical protein [Solirubrobacteraceae bacterium]
VGNGRVEVGDDGSGVEPVSQSAAEQMTIAGAAWKKLGEEATLVVLGRGLIGGLGDAASAALTVYHHGRSYRFDGRVTVPGASASASKQTYRFEFRLPRRVQRWSLDGLVLRWDGGEFELPLPAASGAASRGLPPAAIKSVAPEPADRAEPDTLGNAPEERYGGQIREGETELTKLRQELERASSELARVHAETRQAQVQRDEAQRERDRAWEERDRARWLASVSSELEYVERELVERRGDLEQVGRDLAVRRAELERLELDLDLADQEPEDGVITDFRSQASVSPAPPRPPTYMVDTDPQRTVSSAQGQLTAALSEVRKQMERVQLAAEAPPLDEELVEPPPPPPVPEARVETPPPPAPEAPLYEPEPPPMASEPEPLPVYEVPPPPVESAPPPPPPAPEPLAPPPPLEAVAPPEAPAPQPLASAPEALTPPTAHEAPAPEPPAPEAPPGSEPYDEAAATGEGDGAMRFPTVSNAPASRERDRDNWFSKALQRLAEQDREAGGRVLVSLLPAQAIATPRLLRYDLIVRELGIYAVDVDGLGTRIEPRVRPRPMGDSDAWITGSLVQLGDLAARGRQGLIRRLRRYPVTVEGDRGRVDDLIALARTPLGLRDLCEVGPQIEVPLLLRMVASSIVPEWTLGERFTLRFEPTDPAVSPCYLRINDGNSPGVTTQPPLDRPAATVRCRARALIHLLAGVEVPEGEKPQISGASEPLQLLQGWMHRLEDSWSD